MVLIGDATEQLKTLPDGSVHCCVTSPPYYGLRDYGHAGQIGLEETPEAYVARLVEVFAEVRRVLRDDGTLWLNLGDSYGGYHRNKNASYEDAPSNKGGYFENQRKSAPKHAKQLMGIPWKVAFALQADGWILRQDIIWHKPNPMPESVKDRCTKAHEYMFLFAKSKRYYFDSEAMKEKAVGGTPGNITHKGKTAYESGDEKMRTKVGLTSIGARTHRNRRSVWSICVKPYKEAHFAVFPPGLIEPCIKSGCPVGGTVLDPFGGSGTTGQVAKSLGRDSVLIELNPDYKPLIDKRLGSMNKGVSNV